MEINESGKIATELSEIKGEIVKIRKKTGRSLFSGFLVAVFFFVIGCGGGFLICRNWDDIMLILNPGTVANETITLINEKLEKKAKLITASDEITANYNSGKVYKTVLGKKVPLSSKSFSFTYTGTVEAGITDLTKSKVDVDTQNQVVTITLPDVEITNISLDTSNLNTTSQSKNFFNQITIEDFNNAQGSLKEEMKNQALNSGILDEARESAETVLQDLLVDLTSDYQLKFEWEN